MHWKVFQKYLQYPIRRNFICIHRFNHQVTYLKQTEITLAQEKVFTYVSVYFN